MATEEGSVADEAPTPMQNDRATVGSSRFQHFQAPVAPRTPYRRRYSDMSTSPSAEVILKGGFENPPPQDRPRNSLDETELPSTTTDRVNALPDVVLEAMRKRGARGSVSGASGDDSKGKRYAEMMERFQIRRVSRTLSSSSSVGQGAAVNGTAGSATSLRGRSSREPLDYPTPSAMPSAAEIQPAPSHRSFSPPIIPPLGPLSSRFEKPFTEIAAQSDLDPAAMTPRDGTESSRIPRSARSIRFSLHWLLVSWQRRILRDIQYVSLNIKKPISPSSSFSRFRLTTLIVAFTVHVVLFPLETAFFPEDQAVDSGELIEVLIELILVVDFALMFNTAFYNKRNQLVTSRRQIARHYLRTWFLPDLLSSVPVDLILIFGDGRSIETKWLHFTYDVALRSQRLVHVVRLARVMWTVLLDSPERSIFEWLLYSRYSHLLRIAWIVLCIVLIAHYLACGWRLLLHTTPMRGTPLEEYVACFYDVLQLLQGQGVPTSSVTQNIYATVAILMGSIVLAVIFGNVAILVSNFNANSTSYQRKMESVFAVMSKLQLPAPLRERIHQYYEHLWREYESLDGEIVAFSKGLSHTLELEVVLFKYMDLIMHVPFWHEGSPDFQKQLMLSLRVRVYLPDDFIIRRGEVGDEFFMINRGIAELVLGPDSFECTIDPLPDEPGSSFSEVDKENDEDDAVPKTARYDLPTARRPEGGPQFPRGRRGSRANVYSLGGHMTARVTAARSSKYVQKLRRGQTFGEIALLMNYERTANVRALTYVEMCVLHRRDFQRILVKHPKDRKQVITNILTKTMENNEAMKVWCPLKATVHSVFGEGDESKAENISAMHAALLISNAINLPLDDDSIKFGIGVRLREQLEELRDKQRQGDGVSSARVTRAPPVAPAMPVPTSAAAPASAVTANQTSLESPPVEVQKLSEQVKQLESVQSSMASTMLALTQEVQLLRGANEQLQRMIGTYETRLTELMRPANANVPVATTVDLRPVKRRLSRRLSQGSIEDAQVMAIPENKPRVLPFTLMRSASMSSIHSARSVAVSCTTERETINPEEQADARGSAQQSDTARSGRRASYSGVPRSHTMKSLFSTRPEAAGNAKAASLTNVNRAEPSRSSLNSMILMPLRSLLASEEPQAHTHSPTKYADHLFRQKPQKQ